MRGNTLIDFSVLLIMAALFLAGCEYEAPLTEEHSIAVDPAVLGLWEPAPDEGDDPAEDEQLMVLKYSDTEYLIHYPVGKDGTYYRGYPIRIGGILCVQLRIIGTEDGPSEKDEKRLFHVASYQWIDDKLEIKVLNTDLVSDDLKTTEELREAFLNNKENKELFVDPGLFRKISQ